jgi:polysaccharide deacetylase family protein (PEP-CTERM system associated)
VNPSNSSNPAILLTFDIEDWFQVENFKPYIPFSSWQNRELRVEKNTHHLLNLLDSHELTTATDPSTTADSSKPMNASNCPKGTFFVLGWIAERLPHLVREIHARGHEISSHGYGHKLCSQCTTEGLEEDLVKSRKLLEDLIGDPVYGYRAPSFSISDDILKIIKQCGYQYDSSFNSFGIHGRYGRAQLPQASRNGIAARISDTFYELPVSNFRVGNRFLPWAGGAYFRLMPFPLFRRGVQGILKKENTYLFYMHPWEIDLEQPRVNQASLFSKFRHYTNLNKTASKLASLIEAFKDCSFITCYQYLQEAHSLQLTQIQHDRERCSQNHLKAAQ